MTYLPNPCKVTLYDGTVKDAVIYVLDPAKSRPAGEDKPPSERYIDIITQGCQHFGVKQEYIDKLKSHEQQKRKDPADYQKLVVPDGVPTMTMDDVKAADGKEGRPLYTTSNGKVLSHIFPEDDKGPAELIMAQKA